MAYIAGENPDPRWYRCAVRHAFAGHSDYDFLARIASLQVLDRLGHFALCILPVDDRCDLK
jgi:hypothetical protein